MLTKLAIIVPTLNEQKNIPIVYGQVKSILTEEAWELIFVDDDSSDGTQNTVLEIAVKDSRVRLLHRIHRKGLASACIEGMLSSCAPKLAVMDADLQHDVTLLPLMLETLNDEGLDMAIGSRYMHGGGTGEWQPFRKFVSRAATRFSKVFIGNNITDPMSGFFMIRRNCFLEAAPSLSGRGFKILLDILTSNKKICTKELPYQFGKRTVGESKLDILVGLELFFLIFETFSLDIFQLFRHPIWFSHRACPSSKTTLECSHSPAEGGDGLVSSRTQPLNIGLPAPITPCATSRYLLYSAEYRILIVPKS